MAHVLLNIADSASRITLKALLEAEGHRIVNAVQAGPAPDVAVCDVGPEALQCARRCPTLVLATAGDIRLAVAAMKQGVYGYIFVPFQPGEAGMMVQRALVGKPAHRADGVTSSGRIDEAEKELILTTLRQHKNNQTKAARTLGIGRNTLWRKLKKIRGM